MHPRTPVEVYHGRTQKQPGADDRPAPDLSFLDLPAREPKPRRTGWTVAIDNGLSLHHFHDIVESNAELLDLVKFGWGTAIVTPGIGEKVACAKANDVEIYFGGTLFEKAWLQKKVDELRSAYAAFGCRYVEISNGTVAMSNEEKAEYITAFATDFDVLSEVGFKNPERSLELSPSQWVECIRQDLEAGSSRCILEARESGTSGICRASGELRIGLINDILKAGIAGDSLIFEAPTKALQVYFIERLGANVNLANIAMHDLIGLETLRQGLRADTLTLFEGRKPVTPRG